MRYYYYKYYEAINDFAQTISTEKNNQQLTTVDLISELGQQYYNRMYYYMLLWYGIINYNKYIYDKVITQLQQNIGRY